MARTRHEVTSGVTGAAAHLGIDLAEYDQRIRTFIPGYEAMLDDAAAALATAITRRAPVIVDLGIGTGALSEACLRRMPSARIVGVDADAQMLGAARQRLGASLVRTINADFSAAPLPACDAMVASLALHHLPTAAKRSQLFTRIRRALRAGGVLISADCHPAVSGRLATADREAWLRHLEATYTQAEARGYLRAWAREDHYVTLTEEVLTLKRAGFAVDVRASRQGFAVVVATTRKR